MTQSSRKRSRSCDEEGCDFMPISKRINKLHIRSGQLTSDEEGQEDVRLTSENANANGCVVIADGPLHCGPSNGFLQSNNNVGSCGGHRENPPSFDCRLENAASNQNCCVNGVRHLVHHQHHHHSHEHYQSQMNGASTSGMNTVLYEQPQQSHDGADHLMDDGGCSSGVRCSDDGRGPAAAAQLCHDHDNDDGALLESQLQALTRQMHRQIQDMSQVADYDPSLTESENPFYYQVNEMLYRLHVLRMQRMTKNDG